MLIHKSNINVGIFYRFPKGYWLKPPLNRFNRIAKKTAMRISNYPIISLLKKVSDSIPTPTPTNARTLNSLVPLFLSLLLS